MKSEEVIGFPLRARRSVLIGDWLAIVLLLGMSVGFGVLLAGDPSRSKLSFLLVLLPLFFVASALRRHYVHLHISRITVSEHGVEISKPEGSIVIRWNDVKSVARRHGFHAGLVLRFQNGENVFIPSGVKNYATIQSYILQRFAPRSSPVD